ncbi:MAG: hypothetical protein EXS42_08355 [Lacunisphaera sp.]|nr:hypothetical protein [Lacunisphaera sp.]
MADAPAGPSSEEEAAFLAQDQTGESASRPSFLASGPEEKDLPDLPPLEDLVKRIPASTRALMEELLRTRFVTVKRVPKTALKS